MRYNLCADACKRWLGQLITGHAKAIPLSILCLFAGCQNEMRVAEAPHARPVGSVSDEIFRQQEDNAEAAKFVIYQHEFELNKPEWELRVDEPYTGPERGFRLGPRGQDHVRQIARMLKSGITYPVIVERNNTTGRPQTQHKFAVHYGDQLDAARRDIVVRALQAMDVHNADSLVVVAPAFSPGINSDEAAQAWQSAFGAGRGGNNVNSNGGGGLF